MKGKKMTTGEGIIKSIAIILIILLTAFMLSCGGGGGSVSNSGVTKVTVSIGQSKLASFIDNLSTRSSSAIPSNVASVRIVISGDGTVLFDNTYDVAGSTQIVESYNVPNGLNRDFFAVAMDANGASLFQGDTKADLDGTPRDITIQMESVTSEVTGAWSLFHTKQGGVEEGPDFLRLTQSGNSVTFTFIETKSGQTHTGNGAINGNNIELSFAGTDICDNPTTITLTGTISTDGNTITGAYTQPGTGSCGETGTWRAAKAQPPASDISGSWSFFTTPQGGTEQAQSCLTLTQTGSFLTGSANVEGANANIFGILNGNSIQVIAIDPPDTSNCTRLHHVTGTIASDGNSASGTYTQTSEPGGCVPSESGTWRATKGACTPVTPPSVTLNSIAVTPANPSITAGATQQFTAAGTYSDGTFADITMQVTWNSSNSAVATVNSSGLATGVAAGTSNITATSGSITGNTNLTVTAPLPGGFPSNVPLGNYRIDVQVCTSGNTGANCFSGQSFTVGNTDINQFAQAMLDALNTAGQQLGSQGVSSSISYTPWNGTSFTITDNLSFQDGSTASITYTVTKI